MSKRKKIPVETEPIVSCMDCTGECCRAGIGISLTPSERFRHGAKMQLTVKVEPVDYDREIPPLSSEEPAQLIPAAVGIYEFDKDCGYLTPDSKCTIYESPTKPLACDTLEPGSIACLIVRANAGYEDDLPPRIASVVLSAVQNK